MKLLKKVILKFRRYFFQFSDKFERYTNKIYLKKRIRYKFIKRKGKIDKKYKKDIGKSM